VIAQAYLNQWATHAPWPVPAQVEQDLVLSRLIVEIAQHDLLGSELALRGGTCLHKLHLPTPLRYSEDLDYVRRTHTGIKPYTQALGALAERLRLTVSSRQRSGQMVHVYLDAQPTEGIGRIRIKIEMNIAETEPHRTLKTIRHTIKTSWWSGGADIPTYETSELLATKLRALYQRSKGRDLFDLWLGLTVLKIDPDQIVAGFNHYMRGGAFSFPELRDNLAAKVGSTRFLRDLDALVTNTSAGYDPDTAANLVMRELGSRLRNAPSADEVASLGS
jgi:predicted nucleotidyltransferase component of viral defense system